MTNEFFRSLLNSVIQLFACNFFLCLFIRLKDANELLVGRIVDEDLISDS
jgi:hypothetical protein